jgi:hypothetical protein
MYGPDALVYCGPRLPNHALETPNPVIVVEVASPSTRKTDETVKLDAYFSVPSVHHYLIVDPDGPRLVHYGRQAAGTPLRVIVHEGALTLSPPGIEVGGDVRRAVGRASARILPLWRQPSRFRPSGTTSPKPRRPSTKAACDSHARHLRWA